MAGFDDPGLFYKERFTDEGDQGAFDAEAALKTARKTFKEFLRNFNRGGFSFIYRDELRRRYNLGQYFLEVQLDDIRCFNDDLADYLRNRPTQFMPIFEEAAKEVADEITRPRPEDEQEMRDIQIMIKSDENSQSIRSIKSTQVSRLVKVGGIIISASQVRCKATTIAIQCRGCKQTKSNIHLRPGLDGYAMPRKCTSDQSAQMQKCPIDPYFILPDKCRCVDYQVLKLQESPEDVPHGELPRHLQLYCDRFLTDRVAPGHKVTVIGVYSIRKAMKLAKAGTKNSEKLSAGTRAPYVRVTSIEIETPAGLGRTLATFLSPEEEDFFFRLSRQPDIYDKIARSIAPSIYGSQDIKKSIACLLFGGSRKRMPDCLTRRGDINVLLLGDPGTAKSQLLKFVEKAAPTGVYTSGKGSSAAGLTASIVRDSTTRSFIVEGGAMVLADGGVVCIDEFDKMREDDRVAIHEAMEQQTISIAKAGITTTLNSRCAVLAAANSVYGRWDDTKGNENIDFMPTILARFDMIYVVKDQHDEARDRTLAKHVIGVHVNAQEYFNRMGQIHCNQDADAETTAMNLDDNELPLPVLKKYIAFCRSRCGPRLSEEAGRKLSNSYVRMRSTTVGPVAAAAADGTAVPESRGKSAIPITVRQLEAIVRISEALAKMELSPFASTKHVDEALRLFQVSTLDAVATGNLAGVEGFTTEADQEMLSRIEKQLKNRFAIGTQVSEHLVVQDFLRQRYPEHAIHKVLQALIRRGDIQHRMQRKMLYRVK